MSATLLDGRRDWLKRASLLAIGPALGTNVQAQDLPQGTIRIILPMSAGGAADASTRPLLPELEKLLKRPVIIENKPGGLFTIGLQALLQAPADGMTLMYLYNSIASVQAAYKRFDLLKQLRPVGQASSIPMVMLTPGTSRFKTLGDLVAFGRANPGKLTYSTPAQGSAEHLKSVQLLRAAGVQAQDVPYRSGPEMVNAVIAGEVDFTLTAVSFARMFAPKGQVKVMATMGTQRLQEFAEVPTIAETGLSVPPLSFWGGYAVHANTPEPVVRQLHEALSKAAVTPAARDILTPLGIQSTVSASPNEFRDLIASEIAWMSDVAKELKLAQPG
jgi:tripartite-type tricarboxylate transporter receptor subunit TctC